VWAVDGRNWLGQTAGLPVGYPSPRAEVTARRSSYIVNFLKGVELSTFRVPPFVTKLSGVTEEQRRSRISLIDGEVSDGLWEQLGSESKAEAQGNI